MFKTTQNFLRKVKEVFFAAICVDDVYINVLDEQDSKCFVANMWNMFL